MKSFLRVSRNVLGKTRGNLETQLAREAFALEKEIKLTITSSTPRGKLYRIGKITRAASKKLIAEGYKTYQTPAGKTRAITGAKIHRASAPGQPPAKLSGKVLNATRARRAGRLKYKVINSTRYAAKLDSRKGLNRPFFKATAEKFRAGFNRRMKAAAKK